MGKLFGGGGGGGQSVISDPSAVEAWGIAKPTFNYLNPTAVDFTREVMANPSYSGPRVAGLNDFQINSANNFGNFSDRTGTLGSLAQFNVGMGNLGAANRFGTNASNIFDQYFSGDPNQGAMNAGMSFANNPMVDNLITASSRDVTRNLFENQLPGIDRAAAGTGNLNSTRAGVESAIATRGAADRLADLSSNIRNQFFNTGLNQYNQNLANALNTNSQLLNAGNFGINALSSGQNFGLNAFQGGQLAGGLFQGQDQANLDANKAQFDEGFANRLAALQALAGVGSATRVNTAAGISAPQQSTASQLGGLALGTGSLLTGLKAAGMFSDIRMKENITEVGMTPGGLKTYAFEYKPEFKDIAGHGRYVGVMAQEVEKVIPDAVFVADNGYKAVDYSKVR